MENLIKHVQPSTEIIGSSSQAEESYGKPNQTYPWTQIIGPSSQAEESNVVIDGDEIPIEKLSIHAVSNNLVRILRDDNIYTINQLVIKDTIEKLFSPDNVTKIRNAIQIITSKVKLQAEVFAKELEDLCFKSFSRCSGRNDSKVLEVYGTATGRIMEYETFGDILNVIEDIGSDETVKVIGNLIMQIHVDKRQGYSFHARLKKDKERATKEIQLDATRQKLEATRIKNGGL
ncbi:unnamed protein product [Arabis nemorensis]|uniref:Uncharacterized protein n=1 Tax=Arabis nemorensis TaxID=586526 RepID=A0A565CAS0_9BRAS|nr:unnamed protein product [Arabis nemorensis]